MKRFENLFDKHIKKHSLAFALVASLLAIGCGSASAINNASQRAPTEKERIELAEAWNTEHNGTAAHTIRLDGERTLLISETLSADCSIPYRTVEALHFTKQNGIWKVSDSTTLSKGDVYTLKDFRLLYENDLGLPHETFTMIHAPSSSDSNDIDDVLHNKGGRMEIISEQDVTNDGNPNLLNMRYIFADGSAVNLQIAGGNVQNWSDAQGKNHRTATDLSQQFARAISEKTVWHLYPVLSEHGQYELARYQQYIVDSPPDGIWYSKLGGSSPSYDGYQILPDTGDSQSCIVVFQMHGGGWTDSRCAYRVTIGTEKGCSVIKNITSVTTETHTRKDLFDLYYRTGLPLPTVEEGMNHYNSRPIELLTAPDSAAQAIFLLDEPRDTFAGTKVTIQKQNESHATILLTFTDGSGSTTVEMQRSGAYWMPIEIPVTQSKPRPKERGM